ncbi:hypothetical protein QQ045_025112 [Rhodiola kirilowii]
MSFCTKLICHQMQKNGSINWYQRSVLFKQSSTWEMGSNDQEKQTNESIGFIVIIFSSCFVPFSPFCRYSSSSAPTPRLARSSSPIPDLATQLVQTASQDQIYHCK